MLEAELGGLARHRLIREHRDPVIRAEPELFEVGSEKVQEILLGPSLAGRETDEDSSSSRTLANLKEARFTWPRDGPSRTR